MRFPIGHFSWSESLDALVSKIAERHGLRLTRGEATYDGSEARDYGFATPPVEVAQIRITEEDLRGDYAEAYARIEAKIDAAIPARSGK